MRDIVKVIDNIIVAVPQDEKSFIEDLKKVQDDAKYTAPEVMRERWYQLGCVFNRYVPYPAVDEWHEIVARIFTEVK